MSISNTAFSILSFIGFFLVCVPLCWHLKAWRIGTCLYILWTALALLVYCINSIIWKDDAINRAPVWCDVSIRLIYSSSVGITAASLCINRRLYKITTLQTITWSKAEKRRAIMIDLSIGVGVPMLTIIFQYIVQIKRFVILQEIGCYAALLNAPLTCVLVDGPPMILALISAAYAIRSVVIRRRTEADLKKHLFTTSGCNASLWYRLLGLASSEICTAVPITIFMTITNITLHPVFRWISWKDTHLGEEHDTSVDMPTDQQKEISRVVEVPSSEGKVNLGDILGPEVSRWARIFCAIVFFGLFGLAEEARGHYKTVWRFLAKCIGSGTTERMLPLRFTATAERLSLRTVSPRRENGNGAALGPAPDEGKICQELVPTLKPPADAHVY